MFTLTGFADEVSFEFGEQLELMAALGIRNIEFRSAWRTKVLDLDREQLADAKSMLDSAGISVSSVGSDIGKIQITDPFEVHLERARHSVEVAQFFEAPYIRTFSFFIPVGDDPDRHREEVMHRVGAFVELAEAGDVTMLHENEKGIFGDIPRRVVDLVAAMDSPHYRGILDPANYVQCNVAPVDEALPIVRPYTDYIHVKDARASDSAVVPAGEGDGQLRELLHSLHADGFDGFLSIEPHLGEFDAFGGLCGPELWTTAYDALTKVLQDGGIEWC